MPSLASSINRPSHVDPPTRLRLTVSNSLDGVPGQGTWSLGPVYRDLDSVFLMEPQIPKAPPTPRLRIDHVDGSLRVLDAVRDPEYAALERKSARTTTESQLPEPTVPEQQVTSRRPRHLFQLAALATGFITGVVAAFLFGWL